MYTKETGNQKSETLICIQLLRAIAALSVVYVHCTIAGDYNFPSAGAFGVDIFFIISGFIVAYMITKSTEKFLIKRVIRIVPLYFIATVSMTLTVIFLPNLLHSTAISFSSFIKSILFIPGTESRGQSILRQGWTLNYEMFFYVLIFLCIKFMRNKKYLTLICSFVIIIIVFIVNSFHFEDSIIYYYGDTLYLEFIYGIVLYHLYDFSKKHIRKISFNKITKIVLLSILAIINYGFLVFSDFANFRVSEYRCLFYGIPSFIIVVSLLFMEKNIKNNKLIRFGVKLGEASYVMYLIHYHIVMLLARVVFNKIIGENSIFVIELMKIIIAFIVTIFLSIIIYRFIDKPIQKYLRSIIKK